MKILENHELTKQNEKTKRDFNLKLCRLLRAATTAHGRTDGRGARRPSYEIDTDSSTVSGFAERREQ